MIDINKIEFVDLGLISGNKWSKVNLNYYSFSEIQDIIEYIPTIDDSDELRGYCDFFESFKIINGVRCRGLNGKSIYFRLVGSQVYDNNLIETDLTICGKPYGTYWLKNSRTNDANVLFATMAMIGNIGENGEVNYIHVESDTTRIKASIMLVQKPNICIN